MAIQTTLILLVCVFCIHFDTATGTRHASRLFNNLMTNERKHPMIRPVKRHSDPLLLYMNLSLIQILDVVEKSQIITLNMWVFQEWYNHNFKWEPILYGNVTELHIPSRDIWTPDLVLYNNAGGDWDLASSSKNLKVNVRYDGRVQWKPPIIFKSQCSIDVEYFPFDMQNCSLKIGTWTHHGELIDLRHTSQMTNTSRAMFDHCEADIDYAIDLRDYVENVEWDLLDVRARRVIEYYACCPEPYLDLRFFISLRRKTLFYGINLICPCLAISFLTVLVFYLPADSGEKMSLSISILLSLTVFFLLIFEISPPTSIVVPLILKYLLFTMILVTLSVMSTVVVLNIHWRNSDTHVMSPWVRRVFMRTLPRLLLMRKPETERRGQGLNHIYVSKTSNENNSRNEDDIHSMRKKWGSRRRAMVGDEIVNEFELALEGVKRIVAHIKRDDEAASEQDDWKYVAVVLDRLFLWLFSIAALIGVLGIFMQAPSLTDSSVAMTAKDAEQKASSINVTRSCKINS